MIEISIAANMLRFKNLDTGILFNKGFRVGSYGDQVIGFHEHLEQLTLPLVRWE
jgi:hypothetical protein